MKLEWTPDKILELSGHYWASFALHTGVELDLFTLLDEEGLTEEEVSQELKISKRGTKALLRALCALGFIKKEGEIYFDTEESVEFLSKNSPEYLGYMIKHHHYLSKYWVSLPKAVKSGKPVKRSTLLKSMENELEAFLMGMFNNASIIATKVAQILPLSQCQTLLDLGGGPGTYSIHFALKNPDLACKVYDLKQTQPFCEKVVAKYGLQTRVKFVPFNFLKDKIEEKFDAVWMSHILHGEGEKEALKVVKLAAKSLNKGGLIFIHEFILNDDGVSPLFPTLFSLNMLVGTKKGKAYTFSELKTFLQNSKIEEIEMIDFVGPSESRIIFGRKRR
jgi:SAM-dependent methyltransferase